MSSGAPVLGERWNLTPSAWSDLLLGEASPEGVAKDIRSGRVLPWTKTLVRYASDAETILDLGSGRGELSAALALHGKKATLLDWSVDNLQFSSALLRILGVDGHICQADMTRRLPFRDQAFDVVFSCGVLEFFEQDQIVTALSEARRVSRKRAIVMVPNAFSIPYRLGQWYMRKAGTWRWGGELPFYSLKPYLAGLDVRVTEFSIATGHALNFLTMPGGRQAQRMMRRLLPSEVDSRPAFLRQGYLLVSVIEPRLGARDQ